MFGVDAEAIYERFKRIASRAGIGWATPHQMRHTFATNYLRKGGSPLHLQTLGGWADDKMLKRYAAASLTEAALEEARKLE